MYALLLAALSLAGPANAPVVEPAPVPPPTAVMALPPELRERMREAVLATPASPAERLARLLHFMLDEDALAIVYDEDATYSVADTYAARRANCLSFTLLFVAMAREAGLDAQPQEIENTLSWRQEANTIYRNNHINARVHIQGRRLTVDTSGDTVIAVDRPVAIDDRRLIAHYYNNLAMARMAHGEIDRAMQLMDAALALEPTYAPLWSNAGVLQVRAGDLAAAGRAYDKALVLDPKEDGALFNMIGLAHRLGDNRREVAFRDRLSRVQRRDPLHQFMLGMDAERNGDYRQAIASYRRAIHLYPGEHRFHSALARAYLKAGDARRAGKALRRAQAHSEGEVRAAYRAQLRELKRSSN